MTSKQERMCDRAITITMARNSMIESVLMLKELGYGLNRIIQLVTDTWCEEENEPTNL